jgi:GDP-L-fucose synthase
VGEEITMGNLAKLIANLLDFKGEIVYDISKPNGQPRRCLDVSRAAQEFGFKAQTDLLAGLIKTINWYLKEKA